MSCVAAITSLNGANSSIVCRMLSFSINSMSPFIFALTASGSCLNNALFWSKIDPMLDVFLLCVGRVVVECWALFREVKGRIDEVANEDSFYKFIMPRFLLSIGRLVDQPVRSSSSLRCFWAICSKPDTPTIHRRE